MSLPIQFYSVTVPANQTLPLRASGKFLVVKEATARFELNVDGKGAFPIEPGWGLDFGSFSFCTLRNLSITETLTVVISVGQVGSFYNYVRFPGTRLLTTTFTLLDGTPTPTSRAFPGLNNGDRRKQFIISNSDGTRNLEIEDAASGVGGSTVFPLSNFTIETDADLIVRNNVDGDNANIRVSELFYRT
jgi:hypothetical protein